MAGTSGTNCILLDSYSASVVKCIPVCPKCGVKETLNTHEFRGDDWNQIRFPYTCTKCNHSYTITITK